MPEPAVHIQRKPWLLRARLIGPFVRRYRADRALLRVPAALHPIMSMAMAARDGSFVFIRNPKAGCTTVANRAYIWQAGRPCAGVIHRDTECLPHGRIHFPWVVKVLTSGVPVFSFVRHPERRICSAFTSLLDGTRNVRVGRHFDLFLRMGYRPDTDRARNFDIFLDYCAQCLAIDAAWTDPHFRPQVLNLRQDVQRYSFIGRVERLDEDLRTLEAMLGVSVPAGLETAARHNRSEDPYVPTAGQSRRIRDLYAMDFEAFGY